MGLTVAVYAGLRKTEAKYDPDYNFRPYASRDFPGRERDLDTRSTYEYDSVYHIGFGAYSSYGQWRDELARVAGLEGASDAWGGNMSSGPFYELLNFADNEGVLGPVVSRKLAADFALYQSQADEIGDWFLEMYNQMRQAFEIAGSTGGAVVYG